MCFTTHLQDFSIPRFVSETFSTLTKLAKSCSVYCTSVMVSRIALKPVAQIPRRHYYPLLLAQRKAARQTLHVSVDCARTMDPVLLKETCISLWQQTNRHVLMCDRSDAQVYHTAPSAFVVCCTSLEGLIYRTCLGCTGCIRRYTSFVLVVHGAMQMVDWRWPAHLLHSYMQKPPCTPIVCLHSYYELLHRKVHTLHRCLARAGLACGLEKQIQRELTSLVRVCVYAVDPFDTSLMDGTNLLLTLSGNDGNATMMHTSPPRARGLQTSSHGRVRKVPNYNDLSGTRASHEHVEVPGEF